MSSLQPWLTPKMFIDSHCHLDYEPFTIDLASYLKRAQDAGVSQFLSISTRLSKFAALLQIAEQNPTVYCTLGNHPHHAGDEEWWPTEQLLATTAHPKVIGIGEAGLDYYYDYAPRDAQAAVFRAHIDLARQTQLPLVIHARDADAHVAAILHDESSKGAFPFLLHCFTGSLDLAKTGIELGGYVSFSGILTYKTAQNLRDIAAQLPLDRLLIETDAPYLAPMPHRGKTNEPAFVVHTAQELARVQNLTSAEIGKATTDNFYRLFTKAVRP